VIFNSATSPLAALTGLPMGPLCSDPALRVEIDTLIEEAHAVGAALGITVSETARMVDEAIEVAADHRPSMLQDVLARRRTEIDVLDGGIGAQRPRPGRPTPLVH